MTMIARRHWIKKTELLSELKYGILFVIFMNTDAKKRVGEESVLAKANREMIFFCIKWISGLAMKTHR